MSIIFWEFVSGTKTWSLAPMHTALCEMREDIHLSVVCINVAGTFAWAFSAVTMSTCIFGRGCHKYQSKNSKAVITWAGLGVEAFQNATALHLCDSCSHDSNHSIRIADATGTERVKNEHSDALLLRPSL